MRITLLLATGLLFARTGDAQVFGHNKPRYRSFDFKVLETPHFSIYHYTGNPKAIRLMADWSEQWYGMHTDIFRDSFATRNPLIFYNDHAEFQQTNAIFGSVSVGTGGVTEGFKNRVVMPFTMINQQTQQVLGHEMVHAFQFNRILSGDSTSLESLANLPLWMVEGMAEYMSLGRVDPYTAMWLRDAVIHKDVPNIRKMANFRYFPYRYGQAFWSFFSGTYGDAGMDPLFRNTAIYGPEIAVPMTLGITSDELGARFAESVETHYAPWLGDNPTENVIGKKIISDENAGRLNVSPVVSPNGRFMIFLSDKNLFTTDLYLADARDGKILRKVNSLVRDGNVDDFNLLESSGTWSPDSKKFAFVAFSRGRNVILVKNPENGVTLQQIHIPGVSAIAHPTWSPDGKEITFTGMVDGESDLYTYTFKTKKVRRLTSDFFSEVYPDYSPDGKYLIFSSDRRTFEQQKVFGRWRLHLSRLCLADNTIEDYDSIFPGADCINPCYDMNGKVWFVSDRDGFRNLYRYDLGVELLQMTDLLTGISGISRYAPAISVSKESDRIVFTHYFERGYDIYQAKADKFLHQPVDAADVNFDAGTLPGLVAPRDQVVMDNIAGMPSTAPDLSEQYREEPYKPRFKLDYVTNSGIGVSVGGISNTTGLVGGVGMIFSDILGNSQLFTTFSLNGDILDFATTAQYIRQKSRLAWGFTLSHIPFVSGFYSDFFEDTLATQSGSLPVIAQNEYLLRTFQDQISGLVQYPVSKYLRFETSLGVNFRYYRLDRRQVYYDYSGFYLTQSRREKVPLDEIYIPFRTSTRVFYSTYFGMIGDKSFFGLCSPMDGYRYRFDFTTFFGGYTYSTGTADIRYYKRLAPVTLAFRAMHYATLGPESNSFYPILIGSPGLIHGFEYSRVRDIQYYTGINPWSLSGSKVLLSNIEVRLPLTGPERLAALPSTVFFSELAFFLDGGIAFYNYRDLKFTNEELVFSENGEPLYPGPRLAFSTGISARINLFGALVVEPFLAKALLKGMPARFGIFLVPGW